MIDIFDVPRDKVLLQFDIRTYADLSVFCKDLDPYAEDFTAMTMFLYAITRNHWALFDIVADTAAKHKISYHRARQYHLTGNVEWLTSSDK